MALMRRLLLPPSLLAFALLSSACSDSGEGAPDAGHPVDQCLDPADMALSLDLQSDAGLLDGGSYTLMGAILEHCAREDCIDVIIMGGDVYGCLDTCMEPTVAGDLSPGCRGCFINNVLCAQSECLIPCLGSDTAACTECSNTMCIPYVELCLGYPSP